MELADHGYKPRPRRNATALNDEASRDPTALLGAVVIDRRRHHAGRSRTLLRPSAWATG
jgi:hypothetical protein